MKVGQKNRLTFISILLKVHRRKGEYIAMDSHFHAYKARYEILTDHIRSIAQSRYVHDMDIFVNLDDLFHNMHRPIVEKETQLCGINAIKQCASHIVNLLAHYKNWAAKNHIQVRVYGYYTTTQVHFKNELYTPNYREYFRDINDPNSTRFYFVNDTISKAIPIAKNIIDYIEDVFLIDSRYLEPSILPLYLTQQKIANYTWKMIISRDLYDLQYSYMDNWIFVSPKGDNTSIVYRASLWKYIGAREHVRDANMQHHQLYNYNLYPLALSVAGNKLRSIPRLKRIGWSTIFKYMDEICQSEAMAIQVLSARFIELLQKKNVTERDLTNNMASTNIQTQVSVMNDIDQTMIDNQITRVSDHEALETINQIYFQEFPINIPFLLAQYKRPRGFLGNLNNTIYEKG